MELNDETWHLVKSTPKVTGFVGGADRARRRSPRPKCGEITQQMEEGAVKPEAEGASSRPART